MEKKAGSLYYSEPALETIVVSTISYLIIFFVLISPEFSTLNI